MSGILLNIPSVGNPLVLFVTPIGKAKPQFYFDANGYVAVQDAL